MLRAAERERGGADGVEWSWPSGVGWSGAGPSAKWGVHILHIFSRIPYFADFAYFTAYFAYFWQHMSFSIERTYFAYLIAYSAYLITYYFAYYFAFFLHFLKHILHI